MLSELKAYKSLLWIDSRLCYSQDYFKVISDWSKFIVLLFFSVSYFYSF